MAEKLADYQDHSPIISDIKIDSPAEGQAKLGEGFGKVADAALKIGTSMNNAASKASYAQTVANIEKASTDTQIQILKDPGHAGQYYKNLEDTTSAIKSVARVNGGDRGRLDYWIATKNNQIKLDAVKADVQTMRIGNAFNFYSSQQDKLNAFRASLNDTSEKGVAISKQLEEGYGAQVRGLVMSRSMTAEQGGTAMKLMNLAGQQVENAHKIQNLYNADGTKQDASAIDYHAANSNPLNPKDPATLDGTPSDENTRFQMHYHTDDQSLQSVRSDIANGFQTDPATLGKLSLNSQNIVYEESKGAMKANGLIQSNTPLVSLQQAYDRVKGENSWLSHEEVGFKMRLNKYINQVKSGNTRELLDNTPIGAEINNRETSAYAAINSSQTLGNDEKMQAAISTRNLALTQRVSTMQAQGLPVNPAPEITSTLSASLASGDSGTVMHTLSTLTDANKMSVIEPLQNPHQRGTLQTAALFGMHNTEQAPVIDFLQANSQVPNPKAQEKDAKIKFNVAPSLERHGIGSKDFEINNTLESELSGVRSLIYKQYPYDEAQKVYAGIKTSFMNNTLYLADKANDYTVSNVSEYMKVNRGLIQGAYNVRQGTNYTLNTSQTFMTKYQSDALANYVLDTAYHENLNGDKEAIANAKARGVLTMSLTPTNQIIARDVHGTVYYRSPMTIGKLAAAKRYLDTGILTKSDKIDADVKAGKSIEEATNDQ